LCTHVLEEHGAAAGGKPTLPGKPNIPINSDPINDHTTVKPNGYPQSDLTLQLREAQQRNALLQEEWSSMELQKKIEQARGHGGAPQTSDSYRYAASSNNVPHGVNMRPREFSSAPPTSHANHTYGGFGPQPVHNNMYSYPPQSGNNADLANVAQRLAIQQNSELFLSRAHKQQWSQHYNAAVPSSQPTGWY